MRLREVSDSGSSEEIEGESAELHERSDSSPALDYRDRPMKEFRDEFEGEYTESWDRPATSEHFPPPEHMVGDINPKYRESLSYRVNGGECARAVERTWRGDRETAAGRRILESEPSDRMEAWAGEPFRSAELGDIRDRVAAGGHGSSAIVEARYSTVEGEPECHVYNVVNNHGAVKVVDGMLGRVYPWSPESGHPELSNVSDLHGNSRRSMAMGWDARGYPLQ